MAIKVKGQIVIDDNQNIISSGIATATNFKTGTTNVHDAGIEVSGINVLGADTPIGSNATIFDDGNATFGGNVEALSLTISGVSVNTSTQVDAKIAALESSLTDGAPGALNTLNELSASLGDDANFASTMTNLIATKANTSSLATVATSGSYNDLTNKPTLGTAAATASSAYATAAQGAKADTALQSSNLVPYDTSAQVTAKITALETSLTDGAPGALNTLNELAASLGDDANFASTITNLIATKADTSSLATVATSGSYNNLSNKPFIPTHTSHITNNSGFITNSGGTEAATGSTVVKRNSSGDINCRLVRPNYQNQSDISGAIAFRVNNSSDNYVRFCSSPSAVRAWLGAGTSSFDGNYNNLSNKPSIPTHTSHLTNNSGYITSSSLPTHTSHLTNNSGYITSADGGNAATLDGYDSTAFARHSTNAQFNKIEFNGVGGNSGNSAESYAIYQESGAWSNPYPDLVIAYHTGIKIGAHPNYNGTRFYNDAPGHSSSMLMSVGDGDGHVRVTNTLYVGGNSVYHAGNKPSLADLGYTGATNADLTGSTPTFTDVYTNGWFRNNQANEGLYNQATGAYFYAQAGNGVWNLTGNSQNVSTSLIFRGTHAGNVEGWIHADGGNYFGFLNDAGQWALKQFKVDGYSPNLWFDEEGNETWTGNPSNDEGKIEYHSNRFYIASGANSTEVVRFRRSSTDVGYVTNDGNMYLTSSFHKVYHAGNKPSLADLGYTGATNANYITNNNQLTNGANYYSSGSSPTFTEVYANNWFRNNQSGEGLYNEATGQHWYSDHDDLWNIAGGSGANGIRFRDEAGGTVRGYLLANNSNQIGFLNSGGSWSLKVDNSGNVTATANVTAYSDIRIKENVRTIDNALDKVTSMRGVYYNRKDSGKACVGVIAQEIEQVLPEVIDTQDTRTTENPDGLSDLKTVAYGNIVGLLIESIKELKAEVETLKQERN